MLKFKEFLLAEAKKVQLHSTHIEDIVLDGGKTETIKLLDGLESMLNDFTAGKNVSNEVTLKADGAPALSFGYHPENGKFFIGTKALFNKVPKINYTHEDIDNNHSGGLADTLHIALDTLKLVAPSKGIYSGDVMFTKDTKNKMSKNDVSYITAHPNAIMYAVPVDSKIGKAWENADFGIIMHTELTGEDFSNLQSKFGVSVDIFKKSSKVWLDDAYITNSTADATFTASMESEYKSALNIAKKLSNGIKCLDIINDGELNKFLNVYNNTFIRAGAKIDPKKRADDFVSWIDAKFQKEIDKRKTQKGKDKQIGIRDEVINSIPKDLEKVFLLQDNIVIMKSIIMKQLDSISKLSTFKIHANGEISVTPNEGYVCLQQGHIKSGIKLVDRYEFSNINFSKDIIKGWER
jgi:hypothetical protein